MTFKTEGESDCSVLVALMTNRRLYQHIRTFEWTTVCANSLFETNATVCQQLSSTHVQVYFSNFNFDKDSSILVTQLLLIVPIQ